MNNAPFEAIAAGIAALPPEAVNAAGGRVVRSMAAKRSGRDVVAYLIVLGHVAIGRGEAIVHVDLLAYGAGLTRRAFSAALAALERDGLVMVERIEKHALRLTLPSLLRSVPNRPSTRPRCEEPCRTLH